MHIGSHGENILKGYLLVLSPTYNRRFFFSIRIVYLRNSLRKVVDNYYNENCAGMARRVENFRGEFVKKRGIPAIAHASVSPGSWQVTASGRICCQVSRSVQVYVI